MQAAAGTGKGLVPDSPQNLEKETAFGLLTPRTLREKILFLQVAKFYGNLLQ